MPDWRAEPCALGRTCPLRCLAAGQRLRAGWQTGRVLDRYPRWPCPPATIAMAGGPCSRRGHGLRRHRPARHPGLHWPLFGAIASDLIAASQRPALGFLTRAIAWVVRGVSGGHRHLAHTLCAASPRSPGLPGSPATSAPTWREDRPRAPRHARDRLGAGGHARHRRAPGRPAGHRRRGRGDLVRLRAGADPARHVREVRPLISLVTCVTDQRLIAGSCRSSDASGSPAARHGAWPRYQHGALPRP